MKNFKTMTKTMPMPMPKKMLAGATAMVALSGFVPAINAASPTATANVGVSVVIQQAITITAGAKVDFGTIILSAVTVVGTVYMNMVGVIVTTALTNEVFLAGGHAVGTMAINSSAGAINIALGAAPTDDGGNISYPYLRIGGTALGVSGFGFNANSNKTVTLVGGIFDIGGRVKFTSKPTPGTYNTKSITVTVTDI